MNSDESNIIDNASIINENPNLYSHFTKYLSNQINRILMKDNYNRKKSFFSKISFYDFLKLIFNVIKFLISVFTVGIYILSTYHENEVNNHHMHSFIHKAEFCIALLISFTLSISFVLSKNKLRFFLDFFNFIDLMIIINIFICNFTLNNPGAIDKNDNNFYFKFFRWSRIFRIFKFFQDNKKDSIMLLIFEKRYIIIFKSIINISSILLLSTSIIHYLITSFPNFFSFDYEHKKLEGSDISFDLIIYYSMITLSTTGFGDIYPSDNSTPTRILISIIVITVVFLFTSKINELNSIFNYDEFSIKRYNGTNHVVLIGDLTYIYVKKFINEFYRNSLTSDVKILIINDKEPNTDIKNILHNFPEKIFYCVGSIFKDNIIELCNIDKASYVFLVSDPWNEINHNSISPDQHFILEAKLLSQKAPSIKICCQFLSNSLCHEWVGWDVAFNSREIQMAIMCKNGIVNGFVTLISNLFTDANFSFFKVKKKNCWISEYINGALNKIVFFEMSKEFYVSKIDSIHRNSINNFDSEIEFNSISYDKLVKEFYLLHGIIIIGLKKKKIYYINEQKLEIDQILLNPFGNFVDPKDELIIICRDANEVKKLLSNKSSPVLIDVSSNVNPTDLMKDTFLRIEETSFFSSNRYFQMTDKKFQLEIEIYFKNHILLICPENLINDFMTIYNDLYEDYLFYVSDLQPSSEWNYLQKIFPKLIYVESSFSDVSDFKKLRVNLAKHVYIFSLKNNLSHNDSIKIIQENFPSTKITVELEDDINLDKFRFENSEKSSIKLFPMLANSQIFFKSFLAELPVIFYKNSNLHEILTKMLGIKKNNNLFNDNNDFNLYKENCEIVAYVYSGDKEIKFEEISKYFLSLNEIILPIAILRSVTNKKFQNINSYLVINPKPEMIVYKGEKILCFGDNMSQEFERRENEIEDENKNLILELSNEIESKRNSFQTIFNLSSKEQNLIILKNLEEEINSLENFSQDKIYNLQVKNSQNRFKNSEKKFKISKKFSQLNINNATVKTKIKKNKIENDSQTSN